MAKGPGVYSDVGKKIRDLLTKDYNFDHKFTVTTTTSSGLTFINSGTKKGSLWSGEAITQLKHNNITADFKVDANANVFTTITINDIAPGFKSIITGTIPDQASGKLDFHYVNEYVGITSSVGLTAAPAVDFTALLGHAGLSVGAEVSVDTSSGNLKKYNAVLGINKPDFTAAITLADKCDTIKASYIHSVNPLASSTVGAEMVHSISKNENTFTVGGSYALDLLTVAKGRLNSAGKIGASIQHEFRPKSLITISGEVDARALESSAKLGLAIALKP